MTGETADRDDQAVSRRRPPWGTVVLAGLLMVTMAGWLVSARTRSPEQAAADSSPPDPSVLTATVEERVLEKSVVLRGTVRQEHAVDVTAPVTETGTSVVTGVFVAQGDDVEEGARILELSGRPVLLLGGDIPAYRDIRPGMDGPDVRQLQQALTRLGHAPETDGAFGPATKEAVSNWYRAQGYEPVMTSETVDADLTAARQAVASAKSQHRLAQTAHDDAVKATDATDGSDERAVAEAKVALDAAAAELEAAEDAYDELERTSGPVVPSSEVVFVPALPGRVSALDAAPPGEGSTGDSVPVEQDGDPGGGTGGALMTISAGSLFIEARSSAVDRELFEAGLAATVDVDTTLETFDATVTSVADQASTAPDGTQGYVVRLEPSDDVEMELTASSLRISVVAASTDGEALVVPSAAVYAAADGTSRVTVVHDDGQRERLPVEAGLSADGYMEVVPADTGSLTPDDEVLIGTWGSS